MWDGESGLCWESEKALWVSHSIEAQYHDQLHKENVDQGSSSAGFQFTVEMHAFFPEEDAMAFSCFLFHEDWV